MNFGKEMKPRCIGEGFSSLPQKVPGHRKPETGCLTNFQINCGRMVFLPDQCFEKKKSRIGSFQRDAPEDSATDY
jgi:hypothetical protein